LVVLVTTVWHLIRKCDVIDKLSANGTRWLETMFAILADLLPNLAGFFH